MLIGGVRVSLAATVLLTPPLAGDKPQRYIFRATLGCRCSGDGGWCRRPVPELIPDRESGTCFRTNRSCRLAPAHQGMKIGCIG